jgi:hypothetical protein
MYVLLVVSFHCWRSLAHIDIVIEHNEREKEERSFVLFNSFFPPIHLSFALADNNNAAAAPYRRK